MTIFGWDMSHYDWDRGLTAAEIRAAPGQGVAFMTHKIGEGTGYTDPRFDDFWRATRGLPTLLGAYYVNHPGNQQTQADRFASLLDSQAPGWRKGPFILQVDAEKFDYMDRAPNLAEIKAFVARLVARAPQHRPIVYAPKWLYGDRLAGLGSPLWASNYGSNSAQAFRTAYPGDRSSRWAAYSGMTPAILQYGSKCRIGTQATCDANAFRGTLEQLRALVYPQGGEDMPTAQEIADEVLKRRGEIVDALMQREISVYAPQVDERKNLSIYNVLSLLATRTDWIGNIMPARETAERQAILAAITAQGSGDDVGTAVLARLDELAAAEAARDAELRGLLERHASGELDADAVVAALGRALTAASGTAG